MSPCPNGATRSTASARVSVTILPSRALPARLSTPMSYAIITVGGKQHRVREGERLLVEHMKLDEGKTFNPRVLLVGGNGSTDLSPSTTVTARVLGHELGEKIRIGKYKKRTGYRRHNGYRSKLTRIEIEAIGQTKARSAGAKKPEPKAVAPKAEKAPVAAAAPARTAHPPKGYEEMSIPEIKEHVSTWRRPNVEAALDYERANANRKGAIAALESALAAKEEH